MHANPNEFSGNFHKNTKSTQINPVTEESFQTHKKDTTAVKNNQNNNDNKSLIIIIIIVIIIIIIIIMSDKPKNEMGKGSKQDCH